jgi:hypothetical protein
MIRVIRAQLVLVSIASLFALAASTALSASMTTTMPTHSGKKAKKYKKEKEKVNRVLHVKVTAGTETIRFNPWAIHALEKAKVSTTPVSPATGGLSSGFVFPLVGGTLNTGTGFGSVSTTGGVTFATSFSVPGLFLSETNSTVSSPALALKSTPMLSFTSEQATPPTFPFERVSLKGERPVSHAGAITLKRLPASLTPTGAQFLNQFAAGAFTANESVGTVTVLVTASKVTASK